MIKVSFPGLGIDSFDLNPIAFTLFDKIEVRWYGIIITLGIILAFSYCAWRAKKADISFDDLLDMAIFTIIFGIIGARLYYVLTSLDQYNSFYKMIAIWEGGLAIYGGLIAGGLTIFFVCKYKKISFMKVADSVAPGVMIAQALGRWGNFFNGEAYGEELIEGSPLYFLRMGLLPNIESSRIMHYFHPTFLYESLWNVVGFVIINLVYKKKKFDGQIFYMYIAWYGFGRMFIEGLRTDSLYVGAFRISQVVGFVCFVVGSLMVVLNLVKSRRKNLTAMEYGASYPKFVTTASMGVTKNESTEIVIDREQPKEDEPIEEEPESTTGHSDVSEKLNTLFNVNIDKEGDK